MWKTDLSQFMFLENVKKLTSLKYSSMANSTSQPLVLELRKHTQKKKFKRSMKNEGVDCILDVSKKMCYRTKEYFGLIFFWT